MVQFSASNRAINYCSKIHKLPNMFVGNWEPELLKVIFYLTNGPECTLQLQFLLRYSSLIDISTFLLVILNWEPELFKVIFYLLLMDQDAPCNSSSYCDILV
jgi:hypothetical protein